MNVHSLPAGVYLYRLTVQSATKSFTDEGKLIVVR